MWFEYSWPGLVLVGAFIFINVVAFAVLALDKWRAARQESADRISEGMLFFLATVFGSVGVYVGMYVWRHKTRKWYFQIGIPFLILQNVALVFVLWQLMQ